MEHDGSPTPVIIRRRRRIPFSKPFVAILFAIAMATLFGIVYADYRQHVGEWFADLGVAMLALPYTSIVRAFGDADYAVTGDDTVNVIAAAALDVLLAFLAGAMVEGLARATLTRLFRGRARSG